MTGILLSAILGLLSYMLGIFNGTKLERRLTKEIMSGKRVAIVIDGEGVLSYLENNMVVRKGITLEQIEEENVI